MSTFTLLLVEDEDSQIDDYKKVVADYNGDHERGVHMLVKKTLNDAKICLNKSIDAAIIDLNLGRGTADGAEVINEVKEHFRIPVAILTGTPSEADDEPPVVQVFTKGQHSFKDVLDYLWTVYETGLTKIMGGRGELEKRLSNVFLKNLVPAMEMWIRYGKQDKERTECALLRHALGYLVADLEADGERPFYPEEVYLAPPLNNSLQTGSLVRLKKEGSVHLVITPACDLVIRKNGKPKTDVVVVAEIVPMATVYRELEPNSNKKKNLKNNNFALYYHWLPNLDDFEAGFVDFRRLKTVMWDKFNRSFEHLEIRVAPSFIKDIISRFSAFYARQGQPTINSEN
ncbi:MAG: hypothetical protein OXO49_00880 [Gammaproteobacteria bacterium]|nr:hypothetical protein [Gammaproteobacteria bacterium]MDE0252939.1 hypothetical protein [Gammaproteobacteria bacterium]MDE0402048.1 hypothetical protein [Gammaproteobacteria bacterium]